MSTDAFECRYDIGLQHKPEGQPQSHETLGIGLAQISVNKQNGQLAAKRAEGLLFKADEPRFGSVSSFLQGDHIYLYGQCPGGCDIALARVPKLLAADPGSYERFCGSSWSSNNTQKPACLFKDLPQGAVFETDLFGSDKPYMFVGVSKFADSKIQVGIASKLQGPWSITPVGKATGIKYKDGFMYCIYPHPWALPEDTAGYRSLIVSWSEHFPGGVIAAKLRFKTHVGIAAAEDGLS